MNTFILAVILLALSLFGIAMRKTYDYLPQKELKRQARSGDKAARTLYRAVAYGPSLRVLLWIFIGLTAAWGFVLFSRVAPLWLAFLAVLGLLWYGFVWMPTAHISTAGARMVIAVTPLIAGILNYVHPLLTKVARAGEKRRPSATNTGLYEREDLIDLLDRQRGMPDSRISDAELDIAKNALSFGERTVGEIVVPRRVVKMVSVNDVIGPIMLDELHASGFSRFPVYESSFDNVVGMLYLHDLVDTKHGGTVRDIMRRKVYYVHEDEPLYQVLHAFIKTKHHLFVVINGFEEFIGIITIEDVLEQVIGRKIEDEFDTYDDMRAVAEHHAKKDHDGHKAVPETNVEATE
jgi:CBS domain containing-hemolysin-like protein